MTTHRILVVMRHAKAEPTAPTDHERPLAPRGHGDARAAGEWLRAQGIVPDAALVSDAVRTRETWESLALGAGWDAAPELTAALYTAGPETALDLIRSTPSEVATLVVLGHNPTVAYLAQLLDDGSGDPQAAADMITGGYPTSAVSVFTVPDDWPSLTTGGARLVAHHVGRG